MYYTRGINSLMYGIWKRCFEGGTGRCTRRGRFWNEAEQVPNPMIAHPLFVTVQEMAVGFHSMTTVKLKGGEEEALRTLSIEKRLGLDLNQSLWKFLDIGDGNWIQEGLKRGVSS